MLCGFRPICRGTGCCAVPCAEESVLNATHFFKSGPCGQDCEIGIDLRAICIEYDGALTKLLKALRQRDTTIALAAGSRSCD